MSRAVARLRVFGPRRVSKLFPRVSAPGVPLAKLGNRFKGIICHLNREISITFGRKRKHGCSKHPETRGVDPAPGGFSQTVGRAGISSSSWLSNGWVPIVGVKGLAQSVTHCACCMCGLQCVVTIVLQGSAQGQCSKCSCVCVCVKCIVSSVACLFTLFQL